MRWKMRLFFPLAQGSFQRLDFEAPMLRRLQQLKGT
jgi:hypothetical protein